jgi:hypothetical protein
MWTRDYYARYQNDTVWYRYFGHSHFPQEQLLSTKAADLWGIRQLPLWGMKSGSRREG